MPVYEHACTRCKDSHGNPVAHYFHRPISQAGHEERCPDCNAKTERVYSVSLKKEFFEYDDNQYKCTISSRKEEERQMKAHGHVYTNETKFYNSDRMKSVRRLAKKKPIYSTSAGVTRMDRD